MKERRIGICGEREEGEEGGERCGGAVVVVVVEEGDWR